VQHLRFCSSGHAVWLATPENAGRSISFRGAGGLCGGSVITRPSTTEREN
jgi:hypothetical protein